MNLKKAFSMIEMLIIIVLIGFIVIAELMILNNKINEYGQPYYTAYNALKKAAYNVLADIYCPGDSCPDKTLTAPRAFPTNSQDLCLRLAEFINTAQLNCTLGGDVKDINDMADNLNAATPPRMIATNSFRFYFSGMKTVNDIHDVYGNLYDMNYFVVWVDLNGEKEPNRLTCNESKLYPDIVPFAITTRGEVIPMGFPVYNTLYLTAKIKFPTEIETVEENGEIKETVNNKSSASLSFFEAIYGAWAKDGTTREIQDNIDIPFSILFSKEFPNDSLIHQCYNGSVPNLLRQADYEDRAISYQDKGCMGGSYACRVIIDSNIETRF